MHDATDPWAHRRGGTFLLAFALLAGLPGLTGAQAQAVNWRQALTQDAAWYAGDEARRIADNVLLSQHDNGGWDKNFDHTRRLSDADRAALAADRGQASTIDNGGTTMEMIYLAKVYDATSDPACAEAFLRGFDFLIEMQYDHGGWP